MRRREPPRVLGPYLNHKGGRTTCRIIEIENGKRKAHVFQTEAEAKRARARLTRTLAEQEAKTLEMLIDEFHGHLMHDRGCKPASCEHRRLRLRGFFPRLDVKLASITPRRAEEIYRWNTTRPRAKTKRPAATTSHHVDLALVKYFMRWAVSQRYIAQSPFVEVRLIGQKKVGKLQLRIEEANRWIDAAMERVQAGDAAALAALLCLWCGFRASEVLQRVVRDVDQGGSVIWVDHGKTRSSRRRPKVPEFLRPHLLALCAGKQPTDYVFGEKRSGGPRRSSYLHKRVGRICKLAGVPRVCTHSLRGLHATLAIAGGASTDYVASALGHTSFSMTERHYVDPDALLSKRTERVHAALTGTRTANPALDLLKTLDPDTRRELARLLAASADPAAEDLGKPSPTVPHAT